MNNYYVLRLGAGFKIIYMDPESAKRWHEAGWELREYDSNEKAQTCDGGMGSQHPSPGPLPT